MPPAPKKIIHRANARHQTAEGAPPVGLEQGNFARLAGGGIGLVTGCRIPKSFFVCKGFGDADDGGGVDPWETGSYDKALEQAGIQDFNIMPYTSVMPPESHEILQGDAASHYSHGAVLETIMAQINGVKGDRLSAGVGRGYVRRKSDGLRVGGYAAEYRGHAKTLDVEAVLREDLRQIFDRRYNNSFELVDEKFTIIEEEVKKNFGTALAAICFTSYIVPLVPIADTGGSTGSMRPNAISSAEPAAPAVAGQSSAQPARTDGPVGALEAAAAQRKEPAAAAAGTAQPATAADAPARSHTRKKEKAPRRCKRCNGYMKRHSTLSPECHAAKKAMKR